MLAVHSAETIQELPLRPPEHDFEVTDLLPYTPSTAWLQSRICTRVEHALCHLIILLLAGPVLIGENHITQFPIGCMYPVQHI